MPSRPITIAVGLAMTVCTVLALGGFGSAEPGPVAALLLSMLVAAGGFFLRERLVGDR